MTISSFPPGGTALVIGASGGIGGAFVDHLVRSGAFSHVIGLSRSSTPALDLTSEDSIKAAAAAIAARQAELRLVVVATGILHGGPKPPEKSWRDLDATAMAYSFAINTIGPALILKHVLPLLPRTGKAVFAALSARVGSIGDNHLGGWYAYRAAKAGLNQMVRTASIELARNRPDAICVALHPGTVATSLTSPFAKTGLDVQTPELATERLMTVIEGLTAHQSGGFYDHLGKEIAW